MNRDFYIKQITLLIHTYAESVHSLGKLHLFDEHTQAEYMFRDLLNLIFDATFTNANDLWMNEPGIDLVDNQKKMVVQVSAVTTNTKIQKSLDKIDMKKYTNYRFVFLPITIPVKCINASACNVPHGILFDPQNDVYDVDFLLHKVQSLPIDKIKAVYTLLKKHIFPIIPNDKRPTALAYIVTLLSQENVTDKNLLNNVPFAIETKIQINDLQDIEQLIRDNALYSMQLNSIYESAEKEGRNIRLKIHNTLRHLYEENKSRMSGVELYNTIAQQIRYKVEDSSNLLDSLFDEDIEWGVDVIVAEAFEACKIFEHPTK